MEAQSSATTLVPQLESGGWGLGHRSLWRAHLVPPDMFHHSQRTARQASILPKTARSGRSSQAGTDGLTLYKWTSGKYFL